MTRAVSAKCPECGARLKIDPGLPQARCEFCGTTSVIQRGKAPPAPPTGAPQHPVIHVGTGFRWWILLPALLPVVLGLGITAFVTRAVQQATGDVASGVDLSGLAASNSEHLQWVGNRQPMLADVNGDGVADPVGWVRFLENGNTADHLAAFDANTGARLWATPQITDASSNHLAHAAIAGDKLVVADTVGVMRSFALGNGQSVHATQLGERAKRLCAGPSGSVLVDTTDERRLAFNLATGQLTPVGSGDREQPCKPLWSDEPGTLPGLFIDGRTFHAGNPLPEIDGMSVQRVLRPAEGGNAYALGYRTPGTGVPTAAEFVPTAASGRRQPKVVPVWLGAVP
ncbi:MAG: hypothetical protein JRI55_27415, partial [Deltaproteobacteria bacterium]|nr:hypothetical protein [Deltaproteobacteria bacterium]